MKSLENKWETIKCTIYSFSATKKKSLFFRYPPICSLSATRTYFYKQFRSDKNYRVIKWNTGKSTRFPFSFDRCCFLIKICLSEKLKIKINNGKRRSEGLEFLIRGRLPVKRSLNEFLNFRKIPLKKNSTKNMRFESFLFLCYFYLYVSIKIIEALQNPLLTRKKAFFRMKNSQGFHYGNR